MVVEGTSAWSAIRLRSESRRIVRKENRSGIIAKKLIDVSRQEQSSQREPSFWYGHSDPR